MGLSHWSKHVHALLKRGLGQEYYQFLNFWYQINIRSKFESIDDTFWDKPIFIHIPKTAGNSIRQLNVSCYKWHKPLRFLLKKKPEDRSLPPTFTIVRHPYSRTCSAYFYLINGGSNSFDKLRAQYFLSGYEDINDFVQNGLPKLSLKRWEHFLPQSHFVTDKEGNQIVDHILKFEELTRSWENLAETLNLSPDLPQKNVSGGGYRYKDLDNKSKQIIYRIYKEDFRLFDYRR